MRLLAEDSEDLEVISARLQDAVGKLSDFAWLPKQRRFACVLNRYRWEDAKSKTRVRSGLRFDNVFAVKSQNLKHGEPEAVVSILALKYTNIAEQDVGGVIEITLAGGGAFRLEVECIDAELSDLTTPWAASRKPVHEGDR